MAGGSLSSSTAIMSMPVVLLHGVRLHAIRESQCVDSILEALDSGYGGSVSTMNLDHLRRFARYTDHAALYGKASILTADGMPLIWASNLRGTPLPERVTGSNLIFSLCEGAALAGRSVFFLGGAPEAAQNAATVLAHRYPGLAVAGVSSLPTEDGGDKEEWEKIALTVAAARPDIVFVALGSPKQERLIESLRPILPSSWWIGVGIAFSFVARYGCSRPVWSGFTGLLKSLGDLRDGT